MVEVVVSGGESQAALPYEASMKVCEFRSLCGIAFLAAALLGAGSGAMAAPSPPVPAEDGLSPDQLYLEADTVTRDSETGRTVAKGNVQARYQGRTLTADEVVFEPADRLIRAKGSVRILNPDRTAQFADEIVLDQSL
jgi:LPS-assembly protein